MNEIEKEMLFVTYNEITRETEEADPNDEWDRADTETEFSVQNVYFEKPFECYTKMLEKKHDFKPGDTVYVVVVRYSTGDTFGHDTGHDTGHGIIVEASPSHEEAVKIADSCERGDHKESYNWTGYFESLEGVEIHNRIIH